MTDLFDQLQALRDAPMQAKKRRLPTPSGHAWKPGTGPAGETCGSCKHLVHRRLAIVYLKCGANKAAWTGGRKSDVRAKDAACKKWEAQ